MALEQNYRSTPEILAAANAVIAEAGEGFLKRLTSGRPAGPRPALVEVRDESGQVDFVCAEVLAAREAGVALKAQAVLFRAAHHSGPLEIELTRRDIPFVKFGGLKFLDAAHVKDVLACLRFAREPGGPGGGVPGAAAGAGRRTGGGGSRAAPRRAGRPRRWRRRRWRGAPKGPWADFVALYAALRRGAPGWPAELEAVRRWYEPHLERLHEDAGVRRADLVQLEAVAAGFASRERFLTELTLDPPDATSDLAGVAKRDEDYLILSTIHSAKGQEWSRVFVLNCVDGCIPSDLGTGTSAEIDEERRLLYVAMTRARDELHLIVPQRFFTHGQHRHGDRHVYAARSRFLPSAMLDRFERVAWPPPPGPRRRGRGERAGLAGGPGGADAGDVGVTIMRSPATSSALGPEAIGCSGSRVRGRAWERGGGDRAPTPAMPIPARWRRRCPRRLAAPLGSGGPLTRC